MTTAVKQVAPAWEKISSFPVRKSPFIKVYKGNTERTIDSITAAKIHDQNTDD